MAVAQVRSCDMGSRTTVSKRKTARNFSGCPPTLPWDVATILELLWLPKLGARMTGS